MVSPYDSYSRAKPAGAQFKQMQNEKPEFLQNFCFDPGGSRDKMKKTLGAMMDGEAGTAECAEGAKREKE